MQQVGSLWSRRADDNGIHNAVGVALFARQFDPSARSAKCGDPHSQHYVHAVGHQLGKSRRSRRERDGAGTHLDNLIRGQGAHEFGQRAPV